MDNEELGMALAYLAGALPCRTRWVAVTTTQGEMIGECMGKHDQAHIAALVESCAALHEHLSPLSGMDDLRYALHVGGDGAVLIVTLGNAYHVILNMTNVKSIDAVLAGIREGVAPLVDMLGVNA